MQHEIDAALYGTTHFRIMLKEAQIRLHDKREELISRAGHVDTLRANVQRLNNDCRRYHGDTAHFLVEHKQAQKRLRNNKQELRSLEGQMDLLRVDVQRLNVDCSHCLNEYLHAKDNEESKMNTRGLVI